MHFYDYHKILSYNAPINILIGERGVGKTYGFKKFVISRFLKKKEKFIYLRRYDNELKSALSKNFFGDVQKEFPDVNLATKGRTFTCNNEVFGYAKRLTEAQDLKSTQFEDVKIIVFDEYAIEKNKRYYLPNEGMIIAGVLDSIIRNRNDIKVFFLMNAVEGIEYSPLFTFFDLSLPYNNDIKLFKQNTILLQYMNNEEFQKEREETLIGKLMKDTKYFDYAFKNKIVGKNNLFIEKKTGTAKFSFAVVYKENTFGIWNDYKEGKIYVSTDYLEETYFIFAMTLKDHTPNTFMFSKLKTFGFWKNFLENFNIGNVYFENQFIKHEVMNMIKEYKSY